MPGQPQLLDQSISAAMEKSLHFRQSQAYPFRQSQRTFITHVPLSFLCCNQKVLVDAKNLTVCSFPKTHWVDGPSVVNMVQLNALETLCTPVASSTVKTTLRYKLSKYVWVS